MPSYCALAAPADWRQPASLLGALLPIRPPPDIHIWLGGQRTVSPLHFDLQHNLLAQVVGSKHVTMFAPESRDSLYLDGSNQSSLGAYANLAAVPAAQFPLFAQAEAFSATIHPGDGVFIPSGWWHHVAAIPADDEAQAQQLWGQEQGQPGGAEDGTEQRRQAIDSRNHAGAANMPICLSVNYWWL